MEENKQKRILLQLPKSIRFYQEEDKQLQERQNKLLYWQNVFTVTLGVAQIITAFILAVKFF